MNDNSCELKYGNAKLIIKKSESFVFYATFIANEYKNLDIRKGDIVIDLGANIGDFTVKAGKLLDNTGKIIAIEPNHENVEILKENLELNNIKNVEILECAITDEDGYSYLIGDDVAATVDENNHEGSKIKTLTTDTLLDQLNHPKNIVVKMDIEGGEKYLFKNKEFIHSIREISMELHGKENIEVITNILKNNNFVIKKYKTKDEVKNMLKSFLIHPIDFIKCERLTGYVAIKGAISTFKGNNPVPSVNNKELMVIHAKK